MSDKANRGGHASADGFDQRLKRLDEARWIASRYAQTQDRRALVALYLFNIELKRAAHASEPMIASIRLQWWREALDECADGQPARRHDILIELTDAVTGDPARLRSLGRLVDHWQEQVDRPQSEGAAADPAPLIEIALECLLSEADQARAADLAARFAVADPGRRRKLFKRLDDRVRPALVHLAATDKKGAQTSGLRARWQIFSAMLFAAL